MKAIGGEKAETFETRVTVSVDGTTLTAGDTISFPTPFGNIPASCVVPVLGTVALDAQPAGVWTTTCTTTQCVITLESALPTQFRSQTIRIGVLVHEQL